MRFSVNRRKRAVLAVAALVLILGGAAKAKGAFIVSPNADASVEGGIENGAPFNLTPSGFSSQRYQQVYRASDFASITGPHLITQIAFRPDAGSQGSAFSSTLPDVRIDLSTTSVAPDHLNATFASNVGANDTIVYGGSTGGSLALSSADTGPANGPKDFDIVINLTTPFVYDPSAGNLLLDVRNFSGGTTTQFDAQLTNGDAVSRAYANDGVDSPTATAFNTLGLVTQFTVDPVPEPASFTLLGMGVAGLMCYAGLRRRKKAAPTT
jgi:hypothetical protein